MNDLDGIGRGDQLWLQPAGQKVARPYAQIRDVVLGADGRPAGLIAVMTHADGNQETVIIALERPGHG